MDIIKIQPDHLAGDLGAAMYVHPVQDLAPLNITQTKISLREEVQLFQIKLIQSALSNNKGSWAAAAQDLDTNRSNLHNLATRLGIRKKDKDAHTFLLNNLLSFETLLKVSLFQFFKSCSPEPE